MDGGYLDLPEMGEARLLLELARGIGSTLDLQEVLDKSLVALRRLLNFDGGSIQFVADGALRLVAADPPATPEAYAFRLPLGQGFGGRIVETCEPFYSADATVDPRAHKEGRAKAASAGVRSYFGAPLMQHGEPIGVVQLDSNQVDAFSASAQTLVLAFLPTIAAAVQNARVLEHEVEAINEQLEAERLKTNFLAVVSHELRTPLTSVIGYAETLQAHLEEIEKPVVKVMLGRIARAGRTLEHLIDDLLRLSKAERGTLYPVPKPGDVGTLVRSWAGAIERDTHSLVVELDDDLPQASFDAGRLERVLENLLSNARKFSPPGSEIEIDVRRDDERVVISVTDHGNGIDEVFHERIFERFFQIEPPSTRRAGGLGIGLTLVRYLCTLMDAEITVDSEPGRGSTFTVHLRHAKDRVSAQA